MKKQYNKPWYFVSAALLASLYLTACSNSSAPVSTTKSFAVMVVNATNNQPFSPVAVVAHDASYSVWSIGSAASTDLEYIAEGGSNSQLLASLANKDASAVSGAAAIGPGGSETISLKTNSSTQEKVTLVTMLVNTNDAFVGLRSVDVSTLEIGESMTLTAKVYDAGTEINSESAGTMPGPADGGEGFNAARSDNSDIVTSHAGVVTGDDGLSTSVLDQSHRFDNPAMMVTITRI